MPARWAARPRRRAWARLGRRLAALWPPGRAERGLVAMALARRHRDRSVPLRLGGLPHPQRRAVRLPGRRRPQPGGRRGARDDGAGRDGRRPVRAATASGATVTLWRAACFVVYPSVPDFTSFVVLMVPYGPVDKAAAPPRAGAGRHGRAGGRPGAHHGGRGRGAQLRLCAARALLGSLAPPGGPRSGLRRGHLANAASWGWPSSPGGCRCGRGERPTPPGCAGRCPDVFGRPPVRRPALLDGALTDAHHPAERSAYRCG